MTFMNWIISRCNDASGYFYEIYLDVLGWVYPFWLAATWFYNLSTLFANLAWDFYSFNQWVDSTANKLLEILSWSTIQSYISNWFRYISDLSTIFYYFWQNVTNVITNWWSSTQLTVQGWINNAQSFLQSQINTINTWLTDLQASVQSWLNALPSWNEVWSWFTDWWGNILAAIINWGALTITQIQSLIDSAFTLRQGFWEGWQDMRDTVVNFFADPLGWLEAKFTDWFLGGE